MDEKDIKTLIEDELCVDLRERGVTVVDTHERRNRILACVISGFTMLAVFVGGATYSASHREQVVLAPQEHALEALPVVSTSPSAPNPYDTLTLQGKAVVVYDVRTGTVLYEKNSRTPLPIASLTKIMTALIATEVSDTSARLAIDQYAIETEGDSGLYANETWTFRDLIGFTMLMSSNDGADALATAVGGLLTTTPEAVPAYTRVRNFVTRMNERAREIGLNDTTYRNATGLDESPGTSGATGTAYDMARLIAYTWQHAPEALADTVLEHHTYTSEDGFVRTADNTNYRVQHIPGVLGSKTGYTELAGGNLAVVYNSGLDNPIAVVVLGSTIEGRFDDVEKLVDATYAYIETGWYEYTVAGSTPSTTE